jgi:SAM-dependent methyltransferase
MRARVAVGQSLIRLGRFVQSLAVMIMRPRDLVEFNRAAYSAPGSVLGWTEDALIDAGLSREEKSLLEDLPFRRGKVLVLGLGGGRDAIALAGLGFDVTGVDFVPEMAARAVANAGRRGVTIRTLVQDISRLDLGGESYDAAWLTSGAFSSVPTRRLRLEMLGQVKRSLEPGGYFICQFLVSDEPEFREGWEFLRRAFSWITVGNLSYARGDRLAGGVEFAHYFRAAAEVREEFESAGFEVVRLSEPEVGPRGGAVLRAPVGPV